MRGEQQQRVRGHAVVTRRSRNHDGRKSSSKTSAAIRASGFVPAPGLGGGVGRELAAGGSQQRSYSRYAKELACLVCSLAQEPVALWLTSLSFVDGQGVWYFFRISQVKSSD